MARPSLVRPLPHMQPSRMLLVALGFRSASVGQPPLSAFCSQPLLVIPPLGPSGAYPAKSICALPWALLWFRGPPLSHWHSNWSFHSCIPPSNASHHLPSPPFYLPLPLFPFLSFVPAFPSPSHSSPPPPLPPLDHHSHTSHRLSVQFPFCALPSHS